MKFWGEMIHYTGKNWIEKLPFIQRTKLALASSTASFEKPYVASLFVEDLVIPQSSVTSLNTFELNTPRLSIDLCFDKSSFSPGKRGNLFSPVSFPALSENLCFSTPTQTDDIELLKLDSEKIESVPINFKPTAVFFIKNGFTINVPIIDDQTNLMAMTGLQPVIVDIPFQLTRVETNGKSYGKRRAKSISPPTWSLFPAESETKPDENKRALKKQLQPQFLPADILDLFDLIFPVLQPPLGRDFKREIDLPNEPYPYQWEGIGFLTDNPRVLLGDEMGLGKSIQVIVAIKLLIRKGKVLSTLILCPKAVMGDWEVKLRTWAPELKVTRMDEARDKRAARWSQQSHVYLCTYETFRLDFSYTSSLRNLEVTSKGHTITCPNPACKVFLNVPYAFHNNPTIKINCPTCKQTFFYPLGGDRARTKFDLVVYDEIQKIKNPLTDASKSARLPFSTYRWALSGTPLENKIEDLLTVMTTIKSDIFKGVNTDNLDAVKRAYKPFFKRRRKQDVLKDLPPIMHDEIWLDLLPSQRTSYQLAESQGIIELKEKGETITIQHIFALITRLKQICNFDPGSSQSAKLEYLENEVENLVEQGDKALVFSQYVTTLRLILPSFKPYNPLLYEGSLSTPQRQRMEEKFQAKDSTHKLMLLSLMAGNAGITLTAANYVYHFDSWWNPATGAQALGRVHRIGQRKNIVFNRVLMTNNTIEMRIHAILSKKRQLFDYVVDELSDPEGLAMLSREELFGLFGLTYNPTKSKQA
ncbi:DEAD/DEAH box helicase [Spirosoma sp. BT702]|uniref:DEAD/DEAH box helicase n=1 Tax=Spirosoma profusum TaxID=2771354 RepID=A0A927AVP6_9BACT|nr:DEAD/DEAH box helicase [Spirosoma profusum]MBD2705298.1 DEAD/DEAH box helicase [Spirosoma profusum]